MHLREQQIVRLRPTLGREFQIGRVIDVALPDGQAQVIWQCGPMGCRPSVERLPPDWLLIVPLDEGKIVLSAIDQAAPERALVQLAVQVACLYWLDLRRDGCGAQPMDLQRFVTDAYVNLVRTTPTVREK